MTESQPRPLSADDLVALCTQLEARLHDATVRDAVLLDGRDDLLLFLAAPDDTRLALHVALGGKRARLTTTARRFPRRAFATGPRADRVRELLDGKRFRACVPRPGERAASLLWHAQADPEQGSGSVRLEVELFGARGLWALVAATPTEDPANAARGQLLALSRLPGKDTDRPLRPGATWMPPPSRPGAEQPTQVAAPARNWPDGGPELLEAVDAAFTLADREAESRAELTRLRRLLDRGLSRLEGRLRGARAQRAAADRAADVRTQADMLLAYGMTLAPTDAELRCPDPNAPDRELVVPRDLRLTPQAQAQQLYRTARKHEDGAEVAAQRIAELSAQAERLRGHGSRADEIAALDPELRSTREALEALHDELARDGLIEPRRPPKPDLNKLRLKKLTGGENYRRFRTVEGLLILVGRDNRQNDKLVTRVARGSDVWLHVGRGYAGSHVLMRVEKGRSASLESLLDAGTLAIHFSKVRGAELEEVIYCPAKNVRKPKGMPAGKVVPSATKTLRVRLEPERLERLLSSASGEDKL